MKLTPSLCADISMSQARVMKLKNSESFMENRDSLLQT